MSAQLDTHLPKELTSCCLVSYAFIPRFPAVKPIIEFPYAIEVTLPDLWQTLYDT
jgi:hypothetical protein